MHALRAALGAPAWQIRQDRLAARDEAIRAALAALAPLPPTLAARALERAWAGHRRGFACSPGVAELVDAASRLHGDARPLSWEQIARIGRGHRTPEPCA